MEIIFNSFNYYFVLLFEDILLIFIVYNFFKLLMFNLIVELIWPTQFFNKKNNINFISYRLRSYTEYLLKLRNINSFYKTNCLLLFKFFLN